MGENLRICEKNSVKCSHCKLGCDTANRTNETFIEHFEFENFDPNQTLFEKIRENELKYNEEINKLNTNLHSTEEKLESINAEFAEMKMENLKIENRLKNIDDMFNYEILKLKEEHEKEMKLIKIENKNQDDKMRIEWRNISHKIDEIELKLMKQCENRKIESLKLEIIEKIEVLQGNFHNKIDEIELINDVPRFEIMGMCRQTINESIMQIVIEQKINQLEINSDNEVKGIFEMIVANFDKMNNRFIWSEYFFSRFRPYILRLHIYSSNDELWICLYIYDDVINQYLFFPFTADVTIKLINKNKRKVSKIITKYCQIEKPKNNSFSRSDEFIYPISEWTESGVLESNCFIIECCVELK